MTRGRRIVGRVAAGRVGLASALAIVGLGLVVHGFWIPAKAWLAQRLIASAWRATLRGESEVRPWPWADTWPVARLVVAPNREGPARPETRELFALAGASGEALAFGPGHIASSAAPGQRDNVAFAGHRDTHFAFLRELEVGDRLILESATTRHHYRVTGSEVVHESRVDLVERGARAKLTLVTCYPFDALMPGGPLRFVVHAEMIPGAHDDAWDESRADSFAQADQTE